MKIIIVGNGKVGYAIARQLAVEDHDITIVDDDAAALHRADSTLDVMCVEGNGASISVLDAAGVRGADLVIAVTNLDETNLVCCLIAKKLGAQHTIARVRNPEYRRDAGMLKREIGLDMLINPDLGAAREIARILSFPAAFSVEPFAGGRIDMIGFRVTEEDSLAGVSLNDFHRNRLAEVLICAAHRGDDIIIPDGSFVPRSGDKLYMVGTKAELQKMLRGIGRTLQKVKNVSILGGSRITMYLTWELARSNTKVRIVEMKHDKCLRLSAELPGAMIIEGDGTDADLIESENIFETDAFVARDFFSSLSLFQPLVALHGQLGAHRLEQLHQQNQQDHRRKHHQVFIPVIAVVDGDLAQAAAADDAAHGGVAQNGSQGDGDVLNQGRHAFGDHHLADYLHGRGAHALGRLDDVGVHLPQAALHQPGHKGEGRHHQGNDGGRGTHGGADDQPGQGEHHDHQNQERDGPQQIDDDVQCRQHRLRQGQDAVLLPGHQQHPQGQAQQDGQSGGQHRHIEGLPQCHGKLGQKGGFQLRQGLRRKQITVHPRLPPLPANWG